MSSLSQSLAYIGMLLEHHPRYYDKFFTLTQIDGQFYIQTRKRNHKSTQDMFQFTFRDLEEGLTSKQWNDISREIARRIEKRERIFKNGLKQNRTKNPRQLGTY